MTIRKNYIHRSNRYTIQNISENPQRQPCDPNESRLTLRLYLLQCRNSLVDDLIERAKLDVVTMEDVDVIEPKPGKTLVDAACDALRTEIKAVGVATAFGRDDNFIARDRELVEAIAEYCF